MSRRATVTGPQRIERERRLADILSMRLAGNTLQAIGDAMGVTPQAVHKSIRRALERMATEATEQVRRLEALRLDELTVGVYPAASAGDIAAIDRLLAIMLRRARLLGLDTPVHWAPGGDSDSDPPRVQIEVVGSIERAARIATLEAALAECDPPPRSTSLTGSN